MTKFNPISAIAVSAIGIALIGAAPIPTPDELIRAGNDAIARGDLEGAESLYQQAEERTADPGLVAFNKGTALSRRGDYRRAELSFRRALGDEAIPSERRQRAFYNLGTCLVRQAGDTDIKHLQAAIDCFELTLRETTDDGLRADAGHNLEVAKLLWAKARSRRSANERDPDWEEPKDPSRPPPDPTKKDNTGSEGKDDGPKTPDNGAKIDIGKGPEHGVAPKEVPKAVPGAGNLPVLPDTGKVDEFNSPDDARTHLKFHGERIQRERHKLREEAAQGDRPRANDW
jgi:tetratricopeptide (TPR) repeat protein